MSEAGWQQTLRDVNLTLERMRFLCRIARDLRVMPKNGFQTAMRGIDEAGRMVHGWREANGGRSPSRRSATEVSE